MIGSVFAQTAPPESRPQEQVALDNAKQALKDARDKPINSKGGTNGYADEQAKKDAIKKANDAYYAAHKNWREEIQGDQDKKFEGSLSDVLSFNNKNLAGWIKAWETGDGAKLNEAIIKYLFLIIIVLLIYSTLSFAKFPENGAIRILLAIVVGIIAMFSIQPNELATIMRSYTAMGVALYLFLPVMVLAFFSLVVASKANPMGIFLQKIIWAIYTIYLFVTAGGSLIMSSPKFYNTFIYHFFAFFGGEVAPTANDQLILTVLFVSSIILFVIAVWQNDFVVAWMAKEKRDSEIEGQRARIARSRAYDEARSEDMQE
jgi:hypothetical protein